MLEAVTLRHSYPRVTAEAPSHEELLSFVAAAARGADHGSLRPWRLIELRGEAREALGRAFVDAAAQDASGIDERQAAKLAAKPLRAPLLIAIVVSHRPSDKVTDWEQDVAAAGVAHTLSLLLNEAGWGVMWRTGRHTRSGPVRVAHRLLDSEQLLGWLYVGGRPGDAQEHRKPRIDPSDHLSAL